MSGMAFGGGHAVQSVCEQADGSLLMELSEDPEVAASCGRCGGPFVLRHGRRWRRVRERDWFDRRVWLPAQSRIPGCLLAWIEALVQLLPIAHAAQLTGLHWYIIKQIDRQRIEGWHGQFERRAIGRLIMDEFAPHKGYRYATVIMDAATRRVIWVGVGHSREAIRPFFALLGEEGCRRIEAVAMDMNAAFDLEVSQHCPQAEMVYDLFHVAARFGREVIYLVRVDQANALRNCPVARQVIKRSRWLLHAREIQDLAVINIVVRLTITVTLRQIGAVGSV